MIESRNKAIETYARALKLPIAFIQEMADFDERGLRAIAYGALMMAAAHTDGNVTAMAEELCEACNGHRERRPEKAETE